MRKWGQQKMLKPTNKISIQKEGNVVKFNLQYFGGRGSGGSRAGGGAGGGATKDVTLKARSASDALNQAMELPGFADQGYLYLFHVGRGSEYLVTFSDDKADELRNKKGYKEVMME